MAESPVNKSLPSPSMGSASDNAAAPEAPSKAFQRGYTLGLEHGREQERAKLVLKVKDMFDELLREL